MAAFPGMILTAAGRQLQAKAQIGQQLQFTRVGLGSGAEPVDVENLQALVSEETSLGIQSIDLVGDGTSRIRVVLVNQGVQAGFFIRELGLFAQDPDTGSDVLYAYTHSGQTADFLPAEGGATVVEQTFDLITVVGQAQNVTAVINEYLTLATKQDLNALDPRLLPEGAPTPGAMLQGGPDGSAQWVPRSDALSDAEHLAMIAGA
ncbi:MULTISPECIES: phage tail protein [Phaeobacter]|uniref:phage tail-collar fiber domain-containing protein n=1 Tax=Phaeobacter TaxID=302485 RepID=UPI0006936444|nr:MULTISPECIES: phage tail protein [Phaeobacter]AUQ89405.1 hypothetical protein PhaeoP24_00759 [Phaeobacter inhibens]